MHAEQIKHNFFASTSSSLQFSLKTENKIPLHCKASRKKKRFYSPLRFSFKKKTRPFSILQRRGRRQYSSSSSLHKGFDMELNVEIGVLFHSLERLRSMEKTPAFSLREVSEFLLFGRGGIDLRRSYGEGKETRFFLIEFYRTTFSKTAPK